MFRYLNYLILQSYEKRIKDKVHGYLFQIQCLITKVKLKCDKGWADLLSEQVNMLVALDEDDDGDMEITRM
jgi:hypothetical protein